jgi:phenylacetate-coenzyme A ligase PaaK-like adenylate-forming protein
VAIGASGLVLAVLARRRALRRRDRWTPERLRAHQDRALTELRRWAVRRSAFYRRFHAGGSDRPLAELSVLTKAVLMEHFDEISTRPEIRLADLEHYLAGPDAGEPYRGRWFVCATAGTTGLRGVSAWDRREWVQVLASYNRVFDWAGVAAGLTHRVSMAVVSSTNPSHQSARVGASVHSRWIPTLRIDSGDAVADIVARLNTTQPQVLVAYASMVRLLAEEQLAGRLAIAPRFVFSASEVLTDATRALAARLFTGAGLADVQVRPIDVPTRFRDFDDYWTPFLGGQAPAPGYAMSLSEDRRTELREYLRARLPYDGDGSIPLIARAWAVRGGR